jgi:hypothetical protein
VRAQHLAQLTKMQPKDINIRIKWLGNPYSHTVLKCSLKLYLKVIGCSCYTCLPQNSPTAAQTVVKIVVAPGTPPMAQRLLTIATPKQSSTYTYMQTKGKS